MLEGMHVLVIRPDLTGKMLCTNLEAVGATVWHLPTIEFVSDETSSWQQAYQALPKQDWLIFVSPQAVKASLSFFTSLPTPSVAAVGESTAKLLQTARLNVLYPKEEWSSEALLALATFQAVEGKRITIVTGDGGGRELLADTLKARGAIVSTLSVYRRLLPRINMLPWLTLLQEKKIHVIVSASFMSVQNLKLLIQEENFHLIQPIPLVVVSERIKMLAHKLGFQTIWVAQNATHAAIVHLLAEKRNLLWEMK